MSHSFMEPGSFFFQDLLEGIGYAELSVYDHLMAVPHPETGGLYDIFVPACGHGTEIMFVIIDILGSNSLREVPLRCFRECSYDGVRPLARQEQQRDQNAQQRPHQQKGGKRPAPGLCQQPVAGPEPGGIFPVGSGELIPFPYLVPHRSGGDDHAV